MIYKRKIEIIITNKKRQWKLILFTILQTISITLTNASSSSSSSSSPLINQFNTPDPFVSSSPSIIIGAVCSDGIALLATNPPRHLEHLEEEEEEGLQIDDIDIMPKSIAIMDDDDEKRSQVQVPAIAIVQRIQKLNTKGSISLLSVGLRTDTWRIRNHMMTQVLKDIKLFGVDYDDDDNERNESFVYDLVHDTSNYMSQVAFSEQVTLTFDMRCYLYL